MQRQVNFQAHISGHVAVTHLEASVKSLHLIQSLYFADEETETHRSYATGLRSQSRSEPEPAPGCLLLRIAFLTEEVRSQLLVLASCQHRDPIIVTGAACLLIILNFNLLEFFLLSFIERLSVLETRPSGVRAQPEHRSLCPSVFTEDPRAHRSRAGRGDVYVDLSHHLLSQGHGTVFSETNHGVLLGAAYRLHLTTSNKRFSLQA